MKKWYSVRIPKPCHEDWNVMTPTEKGKFCSVCAKTVIDFTKKASLEVQQIITSNKEESICGHFNREQLDTVNIEIPNVVFNQHYSAIRFFALALLLSMGTSLMSCKSNGKTKKIDSVEIVPSDSISKTNKTRTLGMPIVADTIPDTVEGKMILPPPPNVTIMGEIVKPQKESNKNIYSFHGIDKSPRFKDSKINTKVEFEKRIKEHIQENFEVETIKKFVVRKGKHKIRIQFTIDQNGKKINLKSRATHPELEKYAIQIIEKLPNFIPAKKDGKNVAVRYNLPITFEVE